MAVCRNGSNPCQPSFRLSPLQTHMLSIVLSILGVPLHCNILPGIHQRSSPFSASSKTLTFYNKDTRGEIQRAVFNEEQVKRVFHGSFHKVNTMQDPQRQRMCLNAAIWNIFKQLALCLFRNFIYCFQSFEFLLHTFPFTFYVLCLI